MKILKESLKKTPLYPLYKWLRRTDVGYHILYHFWLRKTRVNRQGKIILPHISYLITNGCNLKCEYCSNFNPYRKGIVPTEELLSSFQSWSKKIVPNRMHIAGGEPFLHPACEEIVLAARAAWPKTNINILTNGVLLPRLKDAFLEKLCTSRIQVVVSKHLTNQKYMQDINRSLARLAEFSVDFRVLEAGDMWIAPYKLDADNVPRPAKSNPKKAWRECWSKYCTNIVGSHLFKCTLLSTARQSVVEGSLGDDWKRVLSHEGISVNEPVESILQYLRSRSVKECSVCPEKYEFVPARQIPKETLLSALETIEGKKDAAV